MKNSDFKIWSFLSKNIGLTPWKKVDFWTKYKYSFRSFQLYGGPYLPRQNLLFHGKTYFSTAKLSFPRQNLLFHGKTYSFTAKLTFPRQNLLFHGKTYSFTAKLSFPRQNLLFHGKTYFFLLPESSFSRSAVSRYFRSGNF